MYYDGRIIKVNNYSKLETNKESFKNLKEVDKALSEYNKKNNNNNKKGSWASF